MCIFKKISRLTVYSMQSQLNYFKK